LWPAPLAAKATIKRVFIIWQHSFHWTIVVADGKAISTEAAKPAESCQTSQSCVATNFTEIAYSRRRPELHV
jgi:hypothetical protein